MGRPASSPSLLSVLLLYSGLAIAAAHRGNRRSDAVSQLERNRHRLESPDALPEYYTRPSYVYGSPPAYYTVTVTSSSASASSDYASWDDYTDMSDASTAMQPTSTETAEPWNSGQTTTSVTLTSEMTVPSEASSSRDSWKTSVVASQTPTLSWTSTTLAGGQPLTSTAQTSGVSASDSAPASMESTPGRSPSSRDTSTEASQVESWTSLSTATPDTSASASFWTAGDTIRTTVTRVISAINSVATPAESVSPVSSSWGSGASISGASPISSVAVNSSLTRSWISSVSTPIESGNGHSGTLAGSDSTSSGVAAPSSERPVTTLTGSSESSDTPAQTSAGDWSFTSSSAPTGSDAKTTTSIFSSEVPNISSTTGQQDSKTTLSTALATSADHTPIWTSSRSAETPVDGSSLSSIRFLTLTSTLVETQQASSESGGISAPATGGPVSSIWTSSNLAAETREGTIRGPWQSASPTDTVVTLSITSRVIRSTRSGSWATVSIASTTTTEDGVWSTAASTGSTQVTNHSSFLTSAGSSSSTYYTYTYTSPRAPFPGAPTTTFTDSTNIPSAPRATMTSSGAQEQGTSTTSEPSPDATPVSSGNGSGSTSRNHTSESWITRTIVSTVVGSAASERDTRSFTDAQTSLETIVQTLTLTIESPSPATSASGRIAPENAETGSGTSSEVLRSSDSVPVPTATGPRWTVHSFGGQTTTITFTPSASSWLGRDSTRTVAGSSTRQPPSWNSTTSPSSMAGTAWTKSAASSWTNDTRPSTHNATGVRTLTRSMILTLTRAGPATAQPWRSTSWNEASLSGRGTVLPSQSSTRQSSAQDDGSQPSSATGTPSTKSNSRADFTSVASGASSPTRVILTKVTLTLRSGTTEVYTTVAVGATDSVRSSWDEGVPTKDGSPGGPGETSKSWRSSMQSDATCTEESQLSSSSKGSESPASCTAIVSAMTTVTKCAGTATTDRWTTATAGGEDCEPRVCNDEASGAESSTEGGSSTRWRGASAGSWLAQPTTFETWVTRKESTLKSRELVGGGGPTSATPLPSNANDDAWGGDSAAHQRQKVTDLGHGVMGRAAAGESRWISKIVGRLRALL